MMAHLGLDASGVHKKYGDHIALRGVDLKVAPGEVCGLLGPNGAGKTSLVSIIAGLRVADAGTVHVDGINVARSGRQARRLVGLAGQETGVYPTLTVRDNLELFARLAGLRGPARARRMDEAAETMELGALLDRLAGRLSGGEQRRLHTAMALVHRPSVLLLDEPTTGVDVATRARLLQALSDLATEGCAIVYSTHYLPEVEEMGASVAIIEGGRILTRGTVAELVARHGDSIIDLTFDGPAPLLDVGSSDGDRVRIRTGHSEADLAGVLALLGPAVSRLRTVNLVRPSLEAVFIAITGRTFDDSSGGGSDDGDATDGLAIAGGAE